MTTSNSRKAFCDSETVRLYFLRDENAIRNTAEMYGVLFTRIAKNITGTDEDAEECVNDAYLRLWNAIPPECPDNLRAYGAKTVRNLALNRLEAMNAGKRGGQDRLLSELEAAAPDAATPEDSYDSARLSAALDAFLRGTDKKNRISFVLRYWYSEPISKIAEKLGESEAGIKSRLHRTRLKLKSYLEKEGISV